MADVKNTNVDVIRYLDAAGLQALWDKISNTFLRDSEVLDALTTYGDGKIITTEDGVFIQKGTFDETTTELSERIEQVAAAQGTNIDKKTIINREGKLQTNLLLSNDKDNHILSIVLGPDAENVEDRGAIISSWDYTEFYNEAVKDGILEDVSLVVIPTDESTESSKQDPGTYLKFIFNTAAGKQPLYVNVTDLIDVYTGSTYIKVDKKDGQSEISIKEAELVSFLKTDAALGITSIVTRLDTAEENISSISATVESLVNSFDRINAIIEQVEKNTADIANIFETLKTVPTEPISLTDIENLQ